MRTRVMLLVVVSILASVQGCRGKKRGPYLAPEPARLSIAQREVPRPGS